MTFRSRWLDWTPTDHGEGFVSFGGAQVAHRQNSPNARESGARTSRAPTKPPKAVVEQVPASESTRKFGARIEGAPPEPPKALLATYRLVVDSIAPVAGPVRLNAAETILDPVAYITSTLAELELAVAARNAGRERSMLVELVDEYLERLGRCGCVARVEVTQ